MSGAPVRVLTVIDALGWGGAEMLLADLATGAPSAGIELSVAHLHDRDGSPAAARLRAAGVEPMPLHADGFSARSLRLVRDHVRAARPDVVHTHLGYSDLLGGLAARTLRVPAVSTIHLAHWDRPDGRRDDAKLWLFAQARRRCAARVLAVSDAAREAYLRRRWDSPDRVVTVHNGVRDGVAGARGAQVRRDLGLAPDDIVVTMLSVLRPGKGHRAAFDAVCRLAAAPATSRVRLLVLGDGPLRAELTAGAAPLGDRVVLAGHRDDVPAVLAATDVLLHPSEQDAFPTALLEAAAASVPVVASAVGGIPEIVQSGRTGVLVPAPADGAVLAQALADVLTDPDRRAHMAVAARRRYEEHFAAEAWARRLRSVYEQVLAEHVTGRPTGAGR